MTTTAEEFEEMARRAEAEKYEQATGKLIRNNVPPRYREAVVEHQGVADWVREWVEGTSKQGLLLTGPTGVGKTFQGYAALMDCIRNRPALWHMSIHAGSVPTLLDMCRPGREFWTDPSPWGNPTKRDIPDEMASCHLLLFDDLGAEKASDWTGEILYRVIDERYMNLRPTIVVSNVPPRELAATIGDRLASRLTEMCQAVVMKGDDRRRQR